MEEIESVGLTQEEVFSALWRIAREINKVVVGQEWLIQSLLTGLFSEIPYTFKQDEKVKTGYGHVLLEGVPGLAKTLTVMTLANTINAKFQRIQFTPDLMPADIIGTRIFDARLGAFRTEKGPIFAHLILADEINRAPQKSQSALLEAMQERQVTVGETTYPLEEPFWILATQNPIEQEGVYSLPEAQVDRFALNVEVGYPSAAEETAMLGLKLAEIQVNRVIDSADVIRFRRFIAGTYVSDAILEYIVRIVQSSRNHGPASLTVVREMVLYGASPRAAQHLLALARTTAFLRGRDYVLPADVKRIAPGALRHRVIRTVRAEAEGVTADEIIAEILAKIPLP